MDDAVREYIDAIAPGQRALFDRIDGLVRTAHPDAELVISYQMPTYKVGRYRLYVGAWKNWVSLYGWQRDRDTGFTARHPDLVTDKGTLRLRPVDAARIPDDELIALVSAALGG